MRTSVHVYGDSVPCGARTDATGWPQRLGDGFTVDVTGGMGVSLASLAEEFDAESESLGEGDGERVVLVHAGHNDAQLSGGEPRVSEEAFRRAAARLDDALAGAERVARHAFVGLVPLLRMGTPGSVPFDESQPERSLLYDDILAETVRTHLPVARPVSAWADRTEDGVHPNEAGHAAHRPRN